MFHMKSRELNQGRQQAGEWENRLFERVTDLLEGFKEVRLNRWRSEHLFDDIVEVSRTAANIKIRTESETLKRLVFSQSAMFVLLGAIVFVVPTFSDAGGDSITKTTTALLFVVGACFGLVQTIPVLTAANAAADNLERLEAELRSTIAAADAGDGEPTRHFDSIEMRNIVFRYVDKSSEAAFKIGPIDFTLRRGDLVFITGGNGSGKSTFLRVLAGLYKPETGEITLDGKRVTDATLESYRSLIAAIFTDYHLFQRLYGIPDPDHAEVDRLLTDFRLHDKTGLTDGEFRTLDLSGGQRKRLALIVSLLEKRPILLLDEWTADQDPEFRRKFYDELLPALTRAGATVVVITHDDRYLNELDLPARRLRMDEGRFVERAFGGEGLMVAYPWSLYRAPPQTAAQRTWWRFFEHHLPNVSIVLMVMTLVAAVLYPHAVVTVPSGQVGVLWKRFGGGTVLDPTQLRGEGLHIILPWDELFLYDLRLQSNTESYNAISNEGVSLTASTNMRFLLKRHYIPALHQAIGPGYMQLLVKPEIGSRMREVMAEYTAEQIYSTKRQEIQDEIRRRTIENLGKAVQHGVDQARLPAPGCPRSSMTR